MQPIKRFLEASFRFKVLLPVIIVMSLILAVTLLIVNRQFRTYSEKSGRMELKSAALRLDNNMIHYKEEMRRRFRTLAYAPVYRAAFEKLDPKTIHVSLGQMYDSENLPSENIEFVFFSPERQPTSANAELMLVQNPTSVFTHPAPQSVFSVSTLSVNRALKGEMANDTVFINNTLYSLVSIPILNRDDERIGALTFGQKMAEQVFQQFNIGSRGQTTLLCSNTPVISTFDREELTDEVKVRLVESFNQLSHKPSAEANSIAIGKNHYFYTWGPLTSLAGDRSLGYLLFTPYDEQNELLQGTQQVLLPAIIILIFIGSAIVLFFINRATAPLRELHAAAEAVGRGDFSQRVNILSRDEFGELGHAFNQMTENIELSQSKLKHTVETLKTTQAQLIQSEKLSAVGEFVAGVAHELNNPLAAVMGFSEMLRNADVGEKHARHLDLVFKSAQRCQKIVQSLLSFARRAAPERRPVSVNHLIEDVLEMIAYPLRTSNVKVVTQFAAKLPVVLADGHQIQQVVLNIINNARQAIESHKGSGRISITTTFDVHFVRVFIEDNGPGIAPENLKRIFDPFFTTKEVGKGTGLGLSLCYGMIREHGGNILVSSQLGSGATFTIELPVADEAAWFETSFMTKTTTATNKLDAREGSGKKILVVDDEEFILQMIKEELVRHGYDVVTVVNGESALGEIRAKKFDAIVCDLKMPGLNGRQVYERLREENPDMSRRMAFVTGDIVGDQLRDFLEAEKRPCLTKPFSLGDLRQTVKHLLAER
jgi:signal transduction histidine kinase/CheY-like chemotaxis protein